MQSDHPIHRRRSIRLAGYDYAQVGAYFLTVCTIGHRPLFGAVREGRMVLSHFGRIAEAEWQRTELLRSGAKLHLHVVMPNHLHGVLLLTADSGGRATDVLRAEAFGKPVPGSVPTIVRAFKSAVTKRMNAVRGTPAAAVWQRNYHEHVIRDEDELSRICDYIVANPAQWEFDRENPERRAPITPEPFW